MNSKLVSFLKYIILLGAGAGLLFIAFKGISLNAIFHEIKQARVSWLLVSIAISFVSLASRAYRWKLLVEPLGYSPSLRNTIYSLSLGYFANLALPRLGEISRCGALSKAESIPFNKLLGTVIIERIIDVISLLICILLVAIIEFKRLGNFFSENITDPLFKKLNLLFESPLLLSAAIIIIFILIGLVYYYVFKKNKENESVFSKILRGFVDGLRSVANLKRPWLFVFHSFFIWFLYYLGVYVCLFALPATENLGWGAALFLLVAGGIGMSAPVQGGIGSYHLLVSQGLMLYGVSQQDGLTFALLLHTLQMIIIVILGVASLLLLFPNKRLSKLTD